VALPDLIEIVPPRHPGQAEIAVPGSKSITNRALILAALGSGETTLRSALWSEDTQVMVRALQKLGFRLSIEPDAEEACNRIIKVHGLGGTVSNSGTSDMPLDLFIGNAGTAARFLAAFVCLGQGAFRLQGTSRMHQRPQAALFDALRELGYRVDSPNDKLPAVIHGSGPRPGRCHVSIEESSQFASALLLCAHHGGWRVSVGGHNSEESPYVAMTSKMIAGWPAQGGSFQIEPDASSGSYFLAAGHLLLSTAQTSGHAASCCRPDSVRVSSWPTSDWQVDASFPRFLPVPATVSREVDLGDSIMTLMVLAPSAAHPVTFNDLGRLRVQECERVAAMRTELTRCGVRAVEKGDSLTVYPSSVQGAEVETYDDHRIAMCFSLLGLNTAGIRIRNPACVKKTFPSFYQKLSLSPPRGLGVSIIDAATRRTLTAEDLFAH
jgi:3-phosphoshikimate 1-carboxyvinyltransferase